MNWTAITVFVLLFGFVTVLGFVAAHWRKGDLDLLHEWGLGGRRFGTFVTWFLIGGDLYTAYTFIAVPALMFGAGAIGFFAVPYTIMIYPILFIVFPRLWSVAHKHGYVTSADFVRGRFGNRWLALAIALTGILATMPYIALQLVGIQVVIGAWASRPAASVGDLPLIIAFVILAAFTYTTGLRAPAMIAIVKDLLIYITVIAAVIVVPLHLGGYGKVFAAIPRGQAAAGAAGRRHARQLQRLRHAGARLGAGAVPLSALDHRHPERIERAGDAAQRSAAAGLFADARIARAAGLHGDRGSACSRCRSSPTASSATATTSRFRRCSCRFPVAGSSVSPSPRSPSARWCRRRSCRSPRPTSSPAISTASSSIPPHRRRGSAGGEDRVAGGQGGRAGLHHLRASRVPRFWLQLLGGMWIIQTLPAVMLGLYTRMLNGWALLIGWAMGFGLGSWMAFELDLKSPVYPLTVFGTTIPGYAALYSLIANIVVSAVLSVVFNLVASDRHKDVTVAEDYA